MHVDTAGLSVMDLTVHNGGVGAGLHLETGDSVVVDVICFEITLKKKQIFDLASWVPFGTPQGATSCLSQK